MGRCSYTWKEWDQEKNRIVEKRCQKEIWEGSDEFCIFHDPSPIKDVHLFRKELKDQMQSETEYHNFRGYCFPENWNFFEEREFEKDADFYEATFQGTANFGDADFQVAIFNRTTFQGYAAFYEATFQDADFYKATFQDAVGFSVTTFQGKANFRGVTFQSYADFEGATFQNVDFKEATFQGTAGFRWATFKNTVYFRGVAFQSYANFSEATFQDVAGFNKAEFQNADFRGADFQNVDFKEATFQSIADFRGATFQEESELTPENNEKIDLRFAKFLFRTYITANLSKALFHRCFIENVAFIDCEWPDNYKIYEEKHMNDKEINLSFNQLETIYRDLKQTMQNHGDHNTAGDLYYREMEMRKKL